MAIFYIWSLTMMDRLCTSSHFPMYNHLHCVIVYNFVRRVEDPAIKLTPTVLLKQWKAWAWMNSRSNASEHWTMHAWDYIYIYIWTESHRILKLVNHLSNLFYGIVSWKVNVKIFILGNKKKKEMWTVYAGIVRQPVFQWWYMEQHNGMKSFLFASASFQSKHK